MPIILNTNNRQKITLVQSTPDGGIRAYTTDSCDVVTDSFEISAGDMVTLLNWYRYQKNQGNVNLMF